MEDYERMTIAGFNRARRIKRHGFAGIITIEDPGIRTKYQLRFTDGSNIKHLILQFEDLDFEIEGIRTPLLEDVSKALEFARNVNGRLLIHCFAGVSRSPAIGLVIILNELPRGHEKEALSQLLKLAPSALQNLLIIKHNSEKHKKLYNLDYR